MKKVWITRTLPAATKSAEAVHGYGFEAYVGPLIQIIPPARMPPMPPKNARLIFTSGNGVGALASLTDRRDWPVLTVGDATAQMASSAGFKDVSSASGTSTELTELAKSLPKDKPVIHCAGTITRGSITEDLIAAGYDAHKHIYYSQVPVRALPFSCAAEFSHILFHSPMAARTFCALTSGAQNITAISISPETNAELEGMTFRGKHVAAKPNEQHMLAALNA